MTAVHVKQPFNLFFVETGQVIFFVVRDAGVGPEAALDRFGGAFALVVMPFDINVTQVVFEGLLVLVLTLGQDFGLDGV